MKLLISLISAVLLFTTVSVNTSFAKLVPNNAPTVHKTVESYEVIVYSDTKNSEGYYVEVGSKKVNAITEISEVYDNNGLPDEMNASVTMVDDYYDIDGNFTESIVTIEKSKNDLITGVGNSNVSTKNSSSPQAIFNENIDKKDLNAVSKENNMIEKSLQILTQNRSSFTIEEKSSGGIKKKDIIHFQSVVKDMKQELIANDSIEQYADPVDRRGAFDNYYNHNQITNEFTIQALSSSNHKYFQRKGQFRTDNNFSNFNSFSSDIKNYDIYIDQRMGGMLGIVRDWVLGVAGGVIFFASSVGSNLVRTGPLGWKNAIEMGVSGVITLAAFTSVGYATAEKAEISRVGQTSLYNVQKTIALGTWYNAPFVLVPGY